MNATFTNWIRGKLVRLLSHRYVWGSADNSRFIILIYHRILATSDPLLESEPDVASFRWQMEALASNFNVMALHDALDKLRDRCLPARTVCITFDDGYRSTHDLALPVLKELGLPATVFIATRYMDGSNMWNDRIMNAVRKMPQGLFDLNDMQLGLHLVSDPASRDLISDKLIQAAKYMPTSQRQTLTDRLELLAGQTHHQEDQSLMLNAEMVRTLVSNGFEVGGHTVTHPILTKLDDREALWEIAQCKEELESITGHPVRLFAYPNGKAGMDYDERHVQMAKQAGYDAAFITTIGTVSNDTDLFQIPRGRPWDKSPLMFQLRLLRWLAQSP